MSGIPSSVAELNNPLWRLTHLYYIVDKSGNRVLFQPNEVQLKLLRDKTKRNLILKSRQQGLSTLIQLILLDQAIFISNITAGVIAQDLLAVSNIFRDKILFAWNNMPDWIKSYRKVVSLNKSSIEFDNGSSIRVATSFRSGTLQYCHISEMGKIAAKYPARAREIITGTIPAIPLDGSLYIESTSEGRNNIFHDMSNTAQSAKAAGRVGPTDLSFHFYGWFESFEYTSDTLEPMAQADLDYFKEIEVASGTALSIGQKNWYVAMKRDVMLGDTQKMRQEYPSLPSEAFEASQEASYYAQHILRLKAEGRITKVPYVPGHPVHTFWDIGRRDGTAVWAMQHIGIDYRFINYYENWDKDFDIYVEAIQRWGYIWGTHHLPHDATQTRQAKSQFDSTNAQKILQDLGLRNIKVVPKTPEKILAINKVRAILPQCYFDAAKTLPGLQHLESYSKVWDTKQGCWGDKPNHNEHSEAADAFAQFATGYRSQSALNASDFMANSPFKGTSPFSHR